MLEKRLIFQVKRVIEKETELLLAEDKRFIAEKNKSRLDMLKDVQSELIAIDQNYLNATNQTAQADLSAVDEKYKDLKTKIETLLQSAIDPAYFEGIHNNDSKKEQC